MQRHALGIALSAILTATLAAQGREAVVWNLSFQLTARDKRDIVDLAADLGIRAPARVVAAGSRCPLVWVRSQPVVEGNRVTTTDLGIRQRTGPDCPPATSRPGHSHPRELDRQNVRHRDVALGPDVTYKDAETIVLAIRRRTLVDVQSGNEIAKVGPPPIDPDQILSVARFDDEPTKRRSPELYGDMYLVTSATHEDFTGRGGGGYFLHVKIRNGRVELHGSGFWKS